MPSEVFTYRVTEGLQRLDVTRNDNGNWVLLGPIVEVLRANDRPNLANATYADEGVAQEAAGALLRGLNDFLDLSEELATNNG